MELCLISVGELSQLIKKRQVSPVEVVEAHIVRIEQLEPELNSFITVLADAALTNARHAEKEIREGRYRGPLHGIPVALKDLFEVKGVRHTAGLKAFDDNVSDRNSAVYTGLKEAGAILVGKLNMNPLAYGPFCDDGRYDYGYPRNPWDLDMYSGGSSGGSATSVAAGQCSIALGSDTGGSVRIPSSLCGVVGLKPTYGRVSRYGYNVLSNSLDTAGPLTRTVEDCALAMNGIAGFDSRDNSSIEIPTPDYTKALFQEVKGLRIGLAKEFFEVPLDPEVEDVVRAAFGLLEEMGAVVRDVSWPLYPYYETISSVILMSEASASYRQLVCERGAELYTPLRLRLEAGLFLSAPDYIRTQKARSLFNRQYMDLFDKIDILAGPTLPITTVPIGTEEVTVGRKRMGLIAALTQYTSAYNLTGAPAMTVPCGFVKNGLPVGLQLAGRPFDEETLIRVAHAYQRAAGWHGKRPTLLA